MINGARQVGKSTILQELLKTKHITKYVTLDDPNILLALNNDAYGYLESYSDVSLALDEVQRCPDLFIAIKRFVDQSKSKSKFLLTGSANILTIPKVSESLAGRMIIHPIWPLSQGEILGIKEEFLTWAFTMNKLPVISEDIISGKKLIDLVINGGYPRAVLAQDSYDQNEWMKSYLDTIIQRDIRELANIDGISELPSLLTLIAERVGSLLNFADLARILKLNQITLKRYYILLKTVFLLTEIQPWFSNREKRIVKAPKVFFSDTGLLAYFKQLNSDSILENRNNFGSLLENFVITELQKQISWHDHHINMYHFRTNTNHEVDIVLEGYGRKIVGIEIKSATKIDKKDLNGLLKLQDIAQENFQRGIILYTGDQVLSLGNNITAMPIQALWDII
jgi:predicted AAA+ superfamily ATPase